MAENTNIDDQTANDSTASRDRLQNLSREDRILLKSRRRRRKQKTKYKELPSTSGDIDDAEVSLLLLSLSIGERGAGCNGQRLLS